MINLISGENITRPDGTIAVRCVLLSGAAPGSLSIGGGDVEELNADDVIAAGSVLITPEKNYIAFADGAFTEKE